MVEAWCAGWTVITNIPVKWEKVKAYARDEFAYELDDRQYLPLAEEKIHEFHKHVVKHCLLVIDEVHLWFNARDYAQANRKLLNFLTLSRHFRVEIILISQAAANIDKQMRRLNQYFWRFRDMQKVKIPGLGITWPFNQILAVRLDYDEKTVYDKKFIWKSSRIWDLYDSFNEYKEAQFEGVTLEDEQRGKAVKLKLATRKEKMKKIAIIAGCMIGLVFYLFYSVVNGLSKSRAANALTGRTAQTVDKIILPTPVSAPTAPTSPAEFVDAEGVRVRVSQAIGLVNTGGSIELCTSEYGWLREGLFCKLGLVQSVQRSEVNVKGYDGNLYRLVFP